MKTIPEIVELASAYYGSAVLFAAIDCDIFVKAAQADGWAPDSRGLLLLANACVAEGLLEKRGEKFFATSASSAALVPGGKADLTQAIRYNRDVYSAWGKLAQFAKTSAPVESPALHLGDDEERTKVFASAMFSRAMGIGRGIVPMLGALNGRLLDLAGGPAAFAILMCQANENLAIETVDLPAISRAAETYVAKMNLSSRISCRAGDYHRDTYEENAFEYVTIFGALHQESPEQILAILKRAARALKRGGKIFILDVMTDATHTAPQFSALFALNMALTTQNGWVFSDDELKGWLREAGLTPDETRLAPPPMPHWLVTGTKM